MSTVLTWVITSCGLGGVPVADLCCCCCCWNLICCCCICCLCWLSCWDCSCCCGVSVCRDINCCWLPWASCNFWSISCFCKASLRNWFRCASDNWAVGSCGAAPRSDTGPFIVCTVRPITNRPNCEWNKPLIFKGWELRQTTTWNDR